MLAQSCASVPPLPDWKSMKQLLGSSGFENILLNSNCPNFFSRLIVSWNRSFNVDSSSSSIANSKSSLLLSIPELSCSNSWIVSSRIRFSFPIFWLREWSSQILGSSCWRARSLSCSFLLSRSKIAPESWKSIVDFR